MMEKLPYDCIGIIFEYLTDTKELVFATMTCNRCKKAFERNISIYKINLNPYYKKIKDNHLKYLKKIKNINITYCNFITDQGLKYLQGVHIINLTNCNYNITDQGLKYLQENCL